MAELLTFGAQELLKRVASLAAQEFSLVWGFKGETTKLRESLDMLEAVLRDAEHPRQGQGEAVKLWVRKLEDIAQQADDVLDDYGYELLRRKVQVRNQIKKKVQDFFSLSNPVVFRDKMARRIKKINTSLDDLKKDASIIGLVARPSLDAATSHGISSDRETYSIIKQDENNIIGRDTVVADAVQALIKPDRNQQSDVSVLAIVGMGGLGKTTMAKSIYHESEISRHFEKRIWICVSTPFEVRSILRGILEVLKPENAAVQAIDAICKILGEELKGKKYLLILDDVWNEDAQKWNDLMSCLLKITDARGCSIIVTTRSKTVAKMVETSLPMCDLKKLSDDDCWTILKNKAAPAGSAPMLEDQEKIGIEIAKKCGGVPLVAKVLGNIMRSKTRNEWNLILDSRIWELPDEEERIMSILKLSFDDLKDSSLKQCFAYCSMFIKDFVMHKDDLVQLWMAQGWLHSNKKNMEMEDRGDIYFNILAERSLFEDVTTVYSGESRETICKMHDLVHDLAERVSNMANSRSLFSKGEALGSTLLKVRSLRVLNLYTANIDNLPSSIGKLTHLRYLNVRGTEVKSFPESIGKLFYLETFKMPYHVEEFPKMIVDMINLRHVYFGKYAKVPAEILGRLTNLRSIPFLKVGTESGPRIEELGGLNHLRDTLTIYNLEHVRDGEEAVKAKLVDKKQIRKLILVWKLSGPSNNVDKQDGVLEGLKPHCNLEILQIQWFMGVKFPSWLLLASNLKEIKLIGCKNCERAPTLGHLPNLMHVWMSRMQKLRCLGPEFYGYDRISGAASSDERNGAFPALRSLYIEGAENLIDWMETTGTLRAFPCLEELTLSNCKQLRSVPSHFPSLKKLEISRVDSGVPVTSILSNELTSLTHLGICNIEGLVSLPEGTLRNNQNFISCKELSCIASDGSDCCASLEILRIRNCPKLRYLPDGLLSLSLKEFEIEDCKSLISIPIIPEQGGLPSLKRLSIDSCPELSSLPDGLQYCTSLQDLSIRSCPKIKSIPIPSEGFPSLALLVLKECPELSSLPKGVGSCSSLTDLKITDCPKVTSIPLDILPTTLTQLTVSNLEESLLNLHGGFTSLRRLTIKKCQSSQIDDLQFGVSLQELRILECPNLETAPSLDKLTSLRQLKIYDCSRLTCLPSLDKLTSLQKLSICDCSRLASLPKGLTTTSPCAFTRLKSLTLGPFWKELDAFPAFHVLPELASLLIYGWPKLMSLPDQIQHLTALTHLRIDRFEGVEAIPEWLVNLSSLEGLLIRGCKNLMYLPSVQSMHRLTKLNYLHIIDCPLLKERCTEESGSEWVKISHIQSIYVE